MSYYQNDNILSIIFKKYYVILLDFNRNFKVKYKRSVLGIVWSLLYPILTMAVMAIVFSNNYNFNASFQIIGCLYCNMFVIIFQLK